MDDDAISYRVLINHEEQYALWPAHKDVPEGWRQVGSVGSRQACLDYVGEVWKDLTPLSARRGRKDLAGGRD